jgi:uncharacterized repeat protein (TIGR03803 family)
VLLPQSISDEVATLLVFGGPRQNGDYPRQKLIFEHGSLFGNTLLGGANGFGTLFSVNATNQKNYFLGSYGDQLGLEDYPSGGFAYDGTSFWGATSATVFKFTLGQ